MHGILWMTNQMLNNQCVHLQGGGRVFDEEFVGLIHVSDIGVAAVDFSLSSL